MKNLLFIILLTSSTISFAGDSKSHYLGMFGLSSNTEFNDLAVTLGSRHKNFFMEGYTLGGGAIGVYEEVGDFRFNVGLGYSNKATPVLGIDYKGFSLKAMRYDKTITKTKQRYVNLSTRVSSGYYPSITHEKENDILVWVGYTIKF